MAVIIRRPYCTNSHADFFVRNIDVCKGDAVASVNGHIASITRLDELEVGGVVGLPISIDDAKKQFHGHLDLTEDDDQVVSWIKSAAHKVERDTGVTLLTSAWRVVLNAYPAWDQPIHLPLYPVQSIDDFTYYDFDGMLQSVASPLPDLVDYGRPVKIALAGTDTWPTDLRTFQPGVIDVTAGWSAPELIPDDLKQAIKILVGQMALYREQDVAGQGMTVTPTTLGYEQWIASWVLPSLG
jgi:uncharacterized phiE125 gp8 family phage protein